MACRAGVAGVTRSITGFYGTKSAPAMGGKMEPWLTNRPEPDGALFLQTPQLHDGF